MSSITSLLSGGLIDTSAPNYANVAARNEKQRKALINLGMEQINAVYGGGTVPIYKPAVPVKGGFNPKSTYYGVTAKGFQPYWAPKGARPSGTYRPNAIGTALNTGGFDLAAMGVMKGLGLSKALGFGDEDSPKEIAKKKYRRGLLFEAPQSHTFEGYGDPFFKAREKAYVDFALPELARQYQQNREAMTYGLANRGLLGSTQEKEGRRELERTAGQGKQQIADTGISQANDLRRAVENARQQSISQLYQTADPAQALTGAIRTASSLEAPSQFAPLGNMFTNIAQQYMTNQLLNSYRMSTPEDDPGISPYLAPTTW